MARKSRLVQLAAARAAQIRPAAECVLLVVDVQNCFVTGALAVRKGLHREVDSYSAFKEANGVTATGLRGYLQERGIRRVFVTGLHGSVAAAWQQMSEQGVKRIQSSDIDVG